MSMITEEFGVIPPDIQTQMLIAPVMGEMIATRAFAIGEQFIVNSTLYKATKAIAIGDTISVGTGANDNCILSDSITQQLDGVINITPTFNSGFYMNGTIKRIGNICYMTPAFAKDTSFDTSQESYTVGTLPANCRPLTSFYVKCMSGKVDLGNLFISNSGVISYYPTNPYRSFGYINCSFVVQ